MTADPRRELIELAASDLFAQRGSHGASIDEIAARAGVTPPVLYDHFESKLAMHRRLLERHYADLRAVWAGHFVGDEPVEVRLPRALDAWFAYIEAHPFAGKMLFQDTTGDPQVQALHRRVQQESRAAVLPLLAAEPGAERLGGSTDAVALEMAWEALRGVLQALASWWYQHPDVPRAAVVATAMNTVGGVRAGPRGRAVDRRGRPAHRVGV